MAGRATEPLPSWAAVYGSPSNLEYQGKGGKAYAPPSFFPPAGSRVCLFSGVARTCVLCVCVCVRVSVYDLSMLVVRLHKTGRPILGHPLPPFRSSLSPGPSGTPSASPGTRGRTGRRRRRGHCPWSASRARANGAPGRRGRQGGYRRRRRARVRSGPGGPGARTCRPACTGAPTWCRWATWWWGVRGWEERGEEAGGREKAACKSEGGAARGEGEGG